MRGTNCFAHKHDSLVPIHNHHIHPLGYHGPNVPENEIEGCANAHYNTHYLLEAMLKAGGSVPWIERRTYSLGVRTVALLGYTKVMAYGAKISP